MATSSDASSDSSLQERKGTTKEEDGEKAVDGPETPAGVRDATAPEAAAAPAPAAEEAAVQEEKAQHARQASRKPGGARKNWQRRDGDSDAWTCPDCRRIIKNLQSSKDQHRVSAYCPTGFGLRTVLKIGKRAKSMASSGRNILRDMKSAVRGSTR